MKITFLTLFPEMFAGPFEHSILKRAQAKGLLEVAFINIRDFGIGTHKVVDDTPYGGGVGMVLKVDVLHKAIEHAKKLVILERNDNEAIESQTKDPTCPPVPGEGRRVSRSSSFQDDKKEKVILMSATGKTFHQATAKAFSKLDHLIIICGHYEGVDERVKQYIDEEVSIGDFVLTGGELPAMLISDAVTRLIPGVITEGATEDESFSNEAGHLEYPHYTRPAEYEGKHVPEVLVSGDHKKIADWRKEKAHALTKKRRPDLLKK